MLGSCALQRGLFPTFVHAAMYSSRGVSGQGCVADCSAREFGEKDSVPVISCGSLDWNVGGPCSVMEFPGFCWGFESILVDVCFGSIWGRAFMPVRFGAMPPALQFHPCGCDPDRGEGGRFKCYMAVGCDIVQVCKGAMCSEHGPVLVAPATAYKQRHLIAHGNVEGRLPRMFTAAGHPCFAQQMNHPVLHVVVFTVVCSVPNSDDLEVWHEWSSHLQCWACRLHMSDSNPKDAVRVDVIARIVPLGCQVQETIIGLRLPGSVCGGDGVGCYPVRPVSSPVCCMEGEQSAEVAVSGAGSKQCHSLREPWHPWIISFLFLSLLAHCASQGTGHGSEAEVLRNCA